MSGGPPHGFSNTDVMFDHQEEWNDGINRIERIGGVAPNSVLYLRRVNRLIEEFLRTPMGHISTGSI